MTERSLFDAIKRLTQNGTAVTFRTNGAWFEVEVWRRRMGRREGIWLNDLTEDRLLQVATTLKASVLSDLPTVKEEDDGW